MHLFRSRPHTQIRRLHARRAQFASGALATALAVGALVSPPSSVAALGSVGRAEAAVPESTPDVRPSFPAIDGVDLGALGYRGVDLDAVTVAALDGMLPELPMERASEIRARMVVGSAHLEGLREAEYLLYETARSLSADVGATRRAQKAAASARAEAEKQVAPIRARLARERELKAERPALDVERDLHVDRDHLDRLEHAAHQARIAEAETTERLEAQLARRGAHRRALERTSGEAHRMERHLEYLGNELRAARAGMRPAGRWLAETWRGRPDLPVVQVEGFRVHASIAGALRDLLDAAEADGIILDGWGHRPTQRQIELREQNCGPTPYDIYQRPSGTCSPPTAKPGRSLHESGLAVDFQHDGQGITSRSSPAYQWLAANAPSYGFYNLPSEPWHWSVSGV